MLKLPPWATDADEDFTFHFMLVALVRPANNEPQKTFLEAPLTDTGHYSSILWNQDCLRNEV